MTPKQVDKLLKLAERYVAVQEAKQNSDEMHAKSLTDSLKNFESLMKKSMGVSHLERIK